MAAYSSRQRPSLFDKPEWMPKRTNIPLVEGVDLCFSRIDLLFMLAWTHTVRARLDRATHSPFTFHLYFKHADTINYYLWCTSGAWWVMTNNKLLVILDNFETADCCDFVNWTSWLCMSGFMSCSCIAWSIGAIFAPPKPLINYLLELLVSTLAPAFVL